MDFKLLLLLTCVLAALVAQPVAADFFFNAPSPSADSLKDKGLMCVPGRTIIKITEKQKEVQTYGSSSDEDVRSGYRRSHSRASTTNDELCKMCVCAADGKHEYCSKRPAMNVNECIVMQGLMDRFNNSLPFEHEKSLAFRIRRDYIWHNDEIPYHPKAACPRAHSYYSNSISANETDIDVGSEVESLLEYSNMNICFYCVCSTDGTHAGCISRSPWFCEYYRFLKTPNAARDMYRNTFQQDRPTYFRQISYRLRRTMDNGMFDFIESGGDTLCCGHPDSHRRQLHNSVRNKLRIMKKKLPKENLLGGGPRGDYEDFIVNND